MPASTKPGEDAFWEVADEFLARGVVDAGTMFGFRCIRAQGEFVAMPGNTFGGMVVKLPAGRVANGVYGEESQVEASPRGLSSPVTAPDRWITAVHPLDGEHPQERTS